ncbi:MAG: DUF2905 domain-containing protein [Megasphaera sp.]|jgi:hypothetical protein|nr:DUF2905 domain-containing protein [Megasphaera sp.]
MGKILMVIGALFFAIGACWTLLEQTELGKFIGHLPGDIHMTHEGFSFHFPIVTCIIISIILSIVLNIVMHR